LLVAILAAGLLARASDLPGRQELLVHAASRGTMPMLRLLVRLGADPGSNRGGSFPLYAAVAHGQLEAAEFLLDAGSPVDSAEPDGATPLMVAASLGNEGAVELLLAHSASVQARMGCGNALDLAVANHRDSIARLLERAGGRPSAGSSE
jgi:ankyrin repeat protein